MHPSSHSKPNLFYTVAFDPPGWRGGRTMAKLLCASLLRQFWSGEIVVFRNFPEPLFPVERKGLEEVFVATPDVGEGHGAGERCLKAALEYRFRAAAMLDASRYEWMAYLDADCLALINGVRPRTLTFVLLAWAFQCKQRHGATDPFPVSRCDLPRDGPRRRRQGGV